MLMKVFRTASKLGTALFFGVFTLQLSSFIISMSYIIRQQCVTRPHITN